MGELYFVRRATAEMREGRDKRGRRPPSLPRAGEITRMQLTFPFLLAGQIHCGFVGHPLKRDILFHFLSESCPYENMGRRGDTLAGNQMKCRRNNHGLINAAHCIAEPPPTDADFLGNVSGPRALLRE